MCKFLYVQLCDEGEDKQCNDRKNRGQRKKNEIRGTRGVTRFSWCVFGQLVLSLFLMCGIMAPQSLVSFRRNKSKIVRWDCRNYHARDRLRGQLAQYFFGSRATCMVSHGSQWYLEVSRPQRIPQRFEIPVDRWETASSSSSMDTSNFYAKIA